MSSPDHPQRPGAVRRRWTVSLGVIILVVVVAVVIDLMLVAGRVAKVDISFPASDAGQTYVIVGSDSRESLPSGLTTDGLGSTADVPGSRADIVLILHVTDAGSSILSVPRDILVRKESGGYTRLALTLTDGPQELVDGLCSTLHIPADHLIIFDFTTFIALVDELGGVDVQIDIPVRDIVTGLDISRTGLIHLDGVQALALARSRQPERFEGGVWVPVQNGAGERTNSAGLIFAAVREKIAAQKFNPARMQQLAWSVSGSLVTDQDTSLYDLIGMTGLAGGVVDLPADGNGDLLALTKSAATEQALRLAGFDQPCVPSATGG